jgi:hypothetical protein
LELTPGVDIAKATKLALHNLAKQQLDKLKNQNNPQQVVATTENKKD